MQGIWTHLSKTRFPKMISIMLFSLIQWSELDTLTDTSNIFFRTRFAPWERGGYRVCTLSTHCDGYIFKKERERKKMYFFEAETASILANSTADIRGKKCLKPAANSARGRWMVSSSPKSLRWKRNPSFQRFLSCLPLSSLLKVLQSLKRCQTQKNGAAWKRLARGEEIFCVGQKKG